MRTSTKHHYGIEQNHHSPTAFQTTQSQNESGRPRRGTELLEGADTRNHQPHLEEEQVFA